MAEHSAIAQIVRGIWNRPKEISQTLRGHSDTRSNAGDSNAVTRALTIQNFFDRVLPGGHLSHPSGQLNSRLMNPYLTGSGSGGGGGGVCRPEEGVGG